MAIQEQAISIPILPMAQKSSETSGPVGRLKRLVNGVVDKYDADGSNLRISKRPGFRSMTRTLADPYGNGGAGGPGIPSPTVIDTLRNQLFAIGSDTVPYIYSAAAAAWQKYYEETILTNSVSFTPIWAKSTQIQCPESATAGSTHCYVWQQGGNCWALVLDDDGTVIRSYFQVGVGGRVKVVSDGSGFLLFTDNASTTVSVFGLTHTGDLIPSISAATLHVVGDTWDVAYQQDIGIVLVHRGPANGSSGVGGTVVTVTNTFPITATAQYNGSISWGAAGTADAGAAIWKNKTGDGYLYLGTLTSSDWTTGYNLNVYKLDTSAATVHVYAPMSGSSVPGLGITNIAGYVTSSRVYGLVSHLPYTGMTPAPNFASNALTEIGYATSSTDNLGYTVVRSAQLASRVTFVSGVPVVYAYYASVPSWYSTLGFGQSGQPTFFLLRADTGAVVGRICHGTAAEDWTWSTWDGTASPPPNSFQVPTPRMTTAGITVSLGQTGQQQVNVGTGSGGIIAVDNFVTTVGITDVSLGAPGTCVELDHETLIPGPLARSFDGVSFSASGIELGPEQPDVVDSGTAGGLSGGEIYGYVITYERMDRSGRKVRSASSGSVQYVVATGTNRSASLTIPTLRLTTHDDVIISVARTLWEDGQQGTTHHKITSDLAPILNDPTVDALTWVDSVTNQQASVGEVLYGGSGAVPASEGGGDGQEVDHDPPPPFSSGCVLLDRAFVVGPTAVSFSLPGSASSPFAFSEGFSMTVPSHDEIVGVTALDTRLVFLCSGSFWACTGSFLDATGAGDIPTPQQLPITMGCSGVFAVIPDGVVYASDGGGFYLLPRDLGAPVYIGGAVEDEMAGATVVSIASDQNNRVYFLTSTNLILVYDLNSKCWLIWTPPTVAKVLAVYKGQLVYSDGTDIFVLTPGTYADNPNAVDQPIVTTIEIEPMSFADVQMFWDLDLFVSGGSDYSLTATAFYDLDTSEPDVFPTFDAGTMDVDGSGHARYNLPITNPECTYLGLTLTDSFPNGPGPGFVLEKMVAAVGVLPGKRRGNLNQRVQA